jgi:hypothetical protein
MSLPYRSPTTRNRHPATSTRRANLSREHRKSREKLPGLTIQTAPAKRDSRRTLTAWATFG